MAGAQTLVSAKSYAHNRIITQSIKSKIPIVLLSMIENQAVVTVTSKKTEVESPYTPTLVQVFFRQSMPICLV